MTSKWKTKRKNLGHLEEVVSSSAAQSSAPLGVSEVEPVEDPAEEGIHRVAAGVGSLQLLK